MSVEKVNEYKEKKVHRKELIAKERRKKRAWRIGGWCILLAVIVLVGWGVGATIYGRYAAYRASLPDYSINSQVISDYAGILETETAEETSGAETSAAAGDETAAASQADETAAASQADETAAASQAESTAS